jgi:hypothetical protein
LPRPAGQRPRARARRRGERRLRLRRGSQAPQGFARGRRRQIHPRPGFRRRGHALGAAAARTGGERADDGDRRAQVGGAADQAGVFAAVTPARRAGADLKAPSRRRHGLPRARSTDVAGVLVGDDVRIAGVRWAG